MSGPLARAGFRTEEPVGCAFYALDHLRQLYRESCIAIKSSSRHITARSIGVGFTITHIAACHTARIRGLRYSGFTGFVVPFFNPF
jgi:hypothetical protein